MSTNVYSTGPSIVCKETVGLALGASNGLEVSAYADTAPDYGRDTAPAAYAACEPKSHSFENACAQANVTGNAMYLISKDVAFVNTYTGSPNLAIECGYAQAIVGI